METNILSSLSIGNIIQAFLWLIALAIVITKQSKQIDSLGDIVKKHHKICENGLNNAVTRELFNANIEHIDTKISHIAEGQIRVETKVDAMIKQMTKFNRNTNN